MRGVLPNDIYGLREAEGLTEHGARFAMMTKLLLG